MKTLKKIGGIFCGMILASCLLPNSIADDDVPAGQMGKGKPFIISAGIRHGYDDNVFTTPSNEQATMYTSISPDLWFKYPMEDSMFEARYILDARYYWDRPESSDWDFFHHFNMHFLHNFSPRLSLDLRDEFVYAQSPEAVASTGQPLRNMGDGYINHASAALTYAWTTQFSTVTTYHNTFNGYNASQVNHDNNYFRHGASQDLRYAFLDTTTGVLNFSYDNYNYGYYKLKNYESYVLTVGADHYLMPTWLISGRVGGQLVDYEHASIGTNANPYANLRSVWYYLPKCSFEASYTYSTSLTDNANYGSTEGHSINFDVTHYWTPKFHTSAGVLLIFNTFNRADSLSWDLYGYQTNSNIHETTLQPYFNAGYDFTNWLSIEVGYLHTTVTSGDPSRPYWDNQFYIGVRGSY